MWAAVSGNRQHCSLFSSQISLGINMHQWLHLLLMLQFPSQSRKSRRWQLWTGLDSFYFKASIKLPLSFLQLPGPLHFVLYCQACFPVMCYSFLQDCSRSPFLLSLGLFFLSRSNSFLSLICLAPLPHTLCVSPVHRFTVLGIPLILLCPRYFPCHGDLAITSLARPFIIILLIYPLMAYGTTQSSLCS